MFAALPIMILMLTLSVLSAAAGAQLVERLRGEITEIKRWGGYVLLLVGTGLVVLGIWAEAFAQILPV
jgi:cytochrome c biogenesis protein CcdA